MLLVYRGGGGVQSKPLTGSQQGQTRGRRVGKEKEREEERWCRGPANTDKCFIPQHTESLRLVPRGRGRGPETRPPRESQGKGQKDKTQEKKRRKIERKGATGQLRDKAWEVKVSLTLPSAVRDAELC